jgi:hypothetical protein
MKVIFPWPTKNGIPVFAGTFFVLISSPAKFFWMSLLVHACSHPCRSPHPELRYHARERDSVIMFLRRRKEVKQKFEVKL